MLEQYANNAATSLAANYTAGDGVLTVASTASFPASGSFRVVIDHELLLVHVADGTTLAIDAAGIEATTDANHSSGAAVTHVLTAGGLVQAIADRLPGLSSSGASPTATMLPNAGTGAGASIVGSDSVGQIYMWTGPGCGAAAAEPLGPVTQITAGARDTPAVITWNFGADIGTDVTIIVNGVALGDFTPVGDDATDAGNIDLSINDFTATVTDSVATITFPWLIEIGGPLTSVSETGGVSTPTISHAGAYGTYEVQQLPVAVATGGTFQLNSLTGGDWGTLNYNCSVADIQAFFSGPDPSNPSVDANSANSVVVTQPGGVGTPFLLTWSSGFTGPRELFTVDGSDLTGAADLLSLVFVAEKASVPYVYLVPAEPNAAALGQVYADATSTTGFNLAPATIEIGAGVAYAWNYLVLE